MISNYSNRCRDYVVLVHLSASLRYLVGMLENYNDIDEDDSWIETGVYPDTPIKSPEIALRRTKDIQEEIWRCELLSSMISSSDFKRPILVELNKCHEAIGQADVPAEMALLDGEDKEAIQICSDGIFRAWDLCGKELFTCQARCSAEADILFPNGYDAKDINSGLDFTLSELNLNTIPTLELSEIAQNWIQLEDQPTAPDTLLIHPNIQKLIERMDDALKRDDYSGVLHTSASIFETLAKDIVGIPSIEDQTLKKFFERYRKDSSLPDEILNYILTTYESRNTMPLAGHGSTKTPSISREEAVTLSEMSRAFVRIEYKLREKKS